MKYILASQSPRRRELLQYLGISYEIHPAKGEEIITKTIPAEVVMELAEQKAIEVFDTYPADEEICVIGADTVVVYGGKILGKPKSPEDAIDTLRHLQNNTHQVYTGVSLIWRVEKTVMCKTFYESTDVTFYPMSEAEIASYVASGDPMDKAGSYGIQTGCAIYISGIRGDYNNVVGLPVARLYQEMKAVSLLNE